jgi:hypothetical protein
LSSFLGIEKERNCARFFVTRNSEHGDPVPSADGLAQIWIHRCRSSGAKDIDRDLICSGYSEMRATQVPWTHIHGPHMNRLWRRANLVDKNVMFLGGAVREPRIETASQGLLHDQLGTHLTCRHARPASPFGFALCRRTHNQNPPARDLSPRTRPGFDPPGSP